MNPDKSSTENVRPEPAPFPSTTERLVDQLRARHWHGLRKYGVTLDRTDLTWSRWIQHHREELLDAMGYLQRIEDETKAVGDNLDELVERRSATLAQDRIEVLAGQVEKLTRHVGRLEAAGEQLAGLILRTPFLMATNPQAGKCIAEWRAARKEAYL